MSGEEVTIDLTHPEEQGWMEGAGKSSEDWWEEAFDSPEEQKERVMERFVDAVAEQAQCPREAAQEAFDRVGEEQVLEWRKTALDIADEEGIYGLERYHEVENAVGWKIVSEDEELEVIDIGGDS